MTQHYTERGARARMQAGLCPECGRRPNLHDGGGGPHGCTLTDNGVTERIDLYWREEEAKRRNR